jgi:hypothetical protein
MKQANAGLCPGDLVEVKAPDEILQTLDATGALDHVPFMPEMVEFCGSRFRISQRVLKACFSGPNSYGVMREFRTNDVVLLDGLRCSGAAHDGCQKACTIFWREEWLRRVERDTVQAMVDPGGRERLRARLKTSTGPKTYFCQASELVKATNGLSRREQLARCVSEVRSGGCSALEMAQRLATYAFWRIRRKVLGEYARGSNKSTPVEGMDLQPGEWVEVKSMEEIVGTLNEAGHNRGLYFSPDMRLFCGGRYRVNGRLDKIISDGTGQMRQLRNTVSLEGTLCNCPYINVGGCSRIDIVYWRENWLRRVPAPSASDIGAGERPVCGKDDSERAPAAMAMQ